MGAARKLARFVAVSDEQGDTKWFGPDDSLPAWAAKQITNPAAWASSPAQDAEDDGESDDSDQSQSYSSMKKGDLEAEVAKRNEGRGEDDLIEVEGKGTIPDLIAALEADDAAQAAAAGDE